MSAVMFPSTSYCCPGTRSQFLCHTLRGSNETFTLNDNVLVTNEIIVGFSPHYFAVDRLELSHPTLVGGRMSNDEVSVGKACYADESIEHYETLLVSAIAPAIMQLFGLREIPSQNPLLFWSHPIAGTCIAEFHFRYPKSLSVLFRSSNVMGSNERCSMA